MLGILQVKLVVVLVLLKLVYASEDIDKVKYFKSLTPEERKEIFSTDDIDHVPEFEIINFEWPKLQKRSSDGSIYITLFYSGRPIDLHLKLAAPIVGPKSLFYILSRMSTGAIGLQHVNPFKEYTFDIYEDENQLASMVVKNDDDGNKYIQSGIIESHNISIHRAPNQNNPELKSCYILKVLDKIFDVDGGRSISGPTKISNSPVPPVKIPDVIYPEILVIVDSLIYNKFTTFEAFISYILNFWNSVNLKYKSLSNPEYKLSIAGIIASDIQDAYPFLAENSYGERINFKSALLGFGKWLYNLKEYVPIDSYDVAIVHSQYMSTQSGWFTASNEIGLAFFRSACNTLMGDINNQVMNVGIFYDDNNYQSIYTAAHELGHMLGANHDASTKCKAGKYIMSAYANKEMDSKKLEWSQCSIDDFHAFLSANPSCLFNIPVQYQKMMETIIKKPRTTTMEPTTTMKPKTTMKPTITKKPITTEKPTTTIKSTTTIKPTTTMKPKTTMKSTTTAITTKKPMFSVTFSNQSNYAKEYTDYKIRKCDNKNKKLPFPKDKIYKIIDSSLIRYSQVSSDRRCPYFKDHVSIKSNFQTFNLEMQGNREQFYHFVIVNKTEIYILVLDHLKLLKNKFNVKKAP